MIQKNDCFFNESKEDSLEIWVGNEKIGEIGLGFLIQTESTPKTFTDILNDKEIQKFISLVKHKKEKDIYITIQSGKKRIKYVYNIETDIIEEIGELEVQTENEMMKLLIKRERSFRKIHTLRVFTIFAFMGIIILMNYTIGVTSWITHLLLTVLIWRTIYKWLKHIVHEKVE